MSVFICSSVHSYVTQFLENLSLLFSETLQLVRACKRDKNVPSAFLKNSRFSHFGQKLTKIGHFGLKCPKLEVFAFFTILSLEFPIFCAKPSSWSQKNYVWCKMCKIMIYFNFHYLRIYIVVNEIVFIIVTRVIDTVLGSITQYTRKHG